jgi:hypothetical protein
MNKAISFMLMGLILVFSIGIISANTLVAGTVYNGSANNVVPGINIIIFCDSYSLNTTSLSDGAYGVVFGTDSCPNITTDLGSYEGIYNNSIIIVKVNPDSEGTPTPISHGGSSRGYYMCGNGICDSGETSQTCLKDCPIINEEETSTELTNINYNNAGNGLSGAETQTSDNTGNPSGITGAVTGALTSTGGIIIIVFVVLIGGVATTISIVRKRKNTIK